LAFVTQPYFKLRWVPQNSVNRIRDIFLTKAKLLVTSTAAISTSNNKRAETATDNCFSYSVGTNDEPAVNIIEMEGLQYLDDEDNAIEILH
jgi:hypothetical protein